MKKLTLLSRSISVLVLLLVAPVSWSEDTSSNQGLTEEVQTFFNDYQSLGRDFDTDIIELYADDAVLSATIEKLDGTEASQRLSGAQYKDLFPTVVQQAKDLDDWSEFSDIQIELLSDSRARISANRYSHYKCYIDAEYYMVVEKQGGEWQIVEEYQASQEAMACEGKASTDPLAMALVALADTTNPHLPANVDADTVLEQIEANGHSLVYVYRLIELTADDISVEQFYDFLTPALTEQSCNFPNLRPLVDAGAELMYRYKGAQGALIGEIRVTAADCL